MRNELEEKLFKKYPDFFEYLKDYEGPLMPIRFGFECNDGWYFILDSLMDSIQRHINSKKDFPEMEIKSKFWRRILKNRYRCRYKKVWKFLNWLDSKVKKEIVPAPKIDITQVKEKFGGLRFYYNGGNSYIDGMVSLAENQSYKTCELCGSTKDIGSTSKWLITICKECYEKDKKNYNSWKQIKE
jgi:hypothetical protein